MNAIAMDISRLIGRSHFSTPTGIDRFELQYANWAQKRSSHFLEIGRNRPIEIARTRATELISALAHRWSAAGLNPLQTEELQRIFAAIDGEAPWPRVKSASISPAGRTFHSWSRRAGKALRTILPANQFAAGASLLHVSHTNLHRPAAFNWLERQKRNGVFYVHDLIPLTHPEFVRPNEPMRHLQRMETILRHAGLVLCNSQATARSFRAFAEERGKPTPPIEVLAPGVEASFRRPNAAVHATRRPYFLVVGTIEPRKNHILLLQTWRAMVDAHGDDVPRLVIAGKRGWENAQVFATLDRCPQLRNAVIEAPNLGDTALAELMAGAAALLSPTFVEGYGMPVAEARAMGTTIIASDIASHREVAGDNALYLDPLDGRGWREAIEAHARYERRQRPHIVQHWDGHFGTLDGLLNEQHDRLPLGG